MDWYTIALATGALAAMALSRNVPRAKWWILLGAASFAVSSAWWNMGWPYSAAFGAATDFVVIAVIYGFARRRWEFRVVNCFQLMILIDILWLFRLIPDHYTYATSLELANWLAVVVIGATGYLEGARHGGHNFSARHPGLAGSLGRHFYSPRKHPPFWRA